MLIGFPDINKSLTCWWPSILTPEIESGANGCLFQTARSPGTEGLLFVSQRLPSLSRLWEKCWAKQGCGAGTGSEFQLSPLLPLLSLALIQLEHHNSIAPGIQPWSSSLLLLLDLLANISKCSLNLQLVCFSSCATLTLYSSLHCFTFLYSSFIHLSCCPLCYGHYTFRWKTNRYYT